MIFFSARVFACQQNRNVREGVTPPIDCGLRLNGSYQPIKPVTARRRVSYRFAPADISSKDIGQFVPDNRIKAVGVLHGVGSIGNSGEAQSANTGGKRFQFQVAAGVEVIRSSDVLGRIAHPITVIISAAVRRIVDVEANVIGFPNIGQAIMIAVLQNSQKSPGTDYCQIIGCHRCDSEDICAKWQICEHEH